MRKRNQKPLRTADFPVPRNLTDDFIASMSSALATDTSVEARYLSQIWLSKFVSDSTLSPELRRSKAIDKWLLTEQTNERTNERLQRWSNSDSVHVLPGVSSRKFLDKVASIVSQILPWTPSLDLLNGGFSGGSSTSKKRVDGHPAIKFLDKADVTRETWTIVSELIHNTRWGSHYRESGLEPRFVRGNVMFTVPKNAEIDRVAAKEPDLNMFFQKSIGNQIRSLLKRVGINLNDQRINGELARVGSIDGSLATLDLSSASDSVTFQLVKRVLPSDWFHIMAALRSQETEIDGVYHTNEMFSSMGNGFTFELESLLFYSICRAVAYFCGVRGTISVYGDDIIIPTEITDSVISALAYCGFSVNLEKSFWDSPFRESCGKHWYGGRDVSPFYLRKPFSTLSDLILTLNQLASWASRCISVVDPLYEEIHLMYRKYIPESLWGGQDLTSRSSLVTGHAPRKELYWPIETIPHNHVGGLLFWMFIAANRTDERDERTSSGSSIPRFSRIRRNKQWTGDLPIFLSKYSV